MAEEKITFTRSQFDDAVAHAVRQATTPGSPSHVHTCDAHSVDPTLRHQWICSSPYCENVSTVVQRCEQHGGRLVTVVRNGVAIEMWTNSPLQEG